MISEASGSTGAPGSGTEVKGLRVLEAYSISPKD